MVKQSDRRAAKKAAKDSDEPAPARSRGAGKLVELGKTLVMGSCLVTITPKIIVELMSTERSKEGAPADTDEGSEGKETDCGAKELLTAEAMYDSLQKRLVWHNSLGLAMPTSSDESKNAWLAMKSPELDWGPKSKKASAIDRIATNVHNSLPQYLHILLALMMLRAFLFRSFLACLPWLVGYQVASLLVTDAMLEKLLAKIKEVSKKPVPEKIPVKFRVAVTMAIHGLVWLFFIYELIWEQNFYEKIPVMGLIAYHAYVVRPVES